VAPACLLLVVLAPAAPAADFSLSCSRPATLALALDEGVWRLTYLGDEPAELTIGGLIPEGATAYMVGPDRRPAERVELRREGESVTIAVEPEGLYLIGPEDLVLRPQVEARLTGESMLAPQKPCGVALTVVNNYAEELEARVALRAPDDLDISPAKLQRVTVAARGEAEIAFEVVKPEITAQDILAGQREVTVSYRDERDNSYRESFALRLEDNPITHLGLVVEGEDFSGQGPEGKAVTLRDDKVNMSKTAFSGWNDQGHYLEWTLNVPEAGEYQVVFRYCVDGQDATRDFRLDGEYPSAACEAIVFADTGGWSNETNDWRHMRLEDEAGQPVVVDLSAGEHTIRMMSVLGDGGCNIDYILFIPAKGP
jgi:hypothetical protein